ncbi:MAG: zinc-ribbon domain-containing protein [Promethearchaeota archaeon]
MSSTNINKEFTNFGRRMTIIAVFTLLSMIFGFIGGIIIIFAVISYIFAFIIIILFLLVLGNTNRAGRVLNNKELLNFRPRFFWGTVIRFIGQILWTIGLWTILNIISQGASRPIGGLILLMVIGAIIIIAGSILRFFAWGGIATFFEENIQIFNSEISGRANTGAKLCKIATILDMSIILSGIGDILRIIGYFMLSVTKRLGEAPVQPVYQPTTPQPALTPAPPSAGPNFCPDCGSSVTPGARFCPNCGSDLS